MYAIPVNQGYTDHFLCHFNISLNRLFPQNYLLGRKETCEMADRNKEALLEVRQTVNLLIHILSCGLNSMTYLGHVRHVFSLIKVCVCV